MFRRKHGAGCVVLAADTGRILLAHRSVFVLQPLTWGGWGGKIDRDEDPQMAALREFSEETRYRGEVAVGPLMVFAKGAFRYHNFLAVVPREFRPRLNWESQGFGWFPLGEWPRRLHPGLKALFADPVSMTTIQTARDKLRAV